MLYPRPLLANQRNINQALSFVGRLRAGGGTEMLAALNASFLQTHKNSDKAYKGSEKAHQVSYLNHIIFITDGSVGNEAVLIKSIYHQLHSARLFTVGIGSAPNSFFMNKAAEFGRGSFTYIGDVNEVKEKMQALFNKINDPAMRDITIEDAQGRALELFPKLIPDLYQGEPLIAAIRKDYETEALIIKGTYNQLPWQQTVTLTMAKNIKALPIYGRAKN
jgi:Ca-activated chloride channel family protein